VGQSGAPVRIRRWYNTKVARRVALVQLSSKEKAGSAG
jgi:hypothetical protein